MRKNAEKMDLSSRNRLLRVPAGSHGFWAHDPLPDPSHDPHVDPRRVTIPLAFTSDKLYSDQIWSAFLAERVYETDPLSFLTKQTGTVGGIKSRSRKIPL